MTEIVLGLGSNLGDRERNLRSAVAELRSRFADVRLSKVYETAPMYVEDQPPFLNAAASARTEWGPLETLKILKEIERTVGRQPAQRYGPREIDIDLLAYGSVRYTHSDKGVQVLCVPHEKLAEREFVLAPLADMGADRVLPGLGRVGDLLAALGQHSVKDAVFSL